MTTVLQRHVFASGAALQLVSPHPRVYEVTFRETVWSESDTQWIGEASFRRIKRNIEREGRP